VSITAQLPVLAVAVFLLGTPHGALDHRLARGLIEPRLGSAWLPAFVVAYLAAAGAMVAAWLIVPAVALALFLALAVLHFGEHDSPSGRTVPLLVRGALPILVPAAAHRAELQQIFGWLGGEGGAALVAWLAGPALLAWLCGAVVTLAVEARWQSRVELVGLAALFVVAPPLIGFSLYFALVHSPRALSSSLQPGERVGDLLRSGLPFSVGAVALAAVGYLALRDTLAFEPALVRTVFWWLAALTVPHMGLALLASRNSPTRGGSSWQGFRPPAAA
jgi:Brp/Blh family beta-carotene 15,15'-monooxygenase